jgi:phage FluMu protein Com
MAGLEKISCENCGKTLFFADIKEGKVSKDCKRCGVRNIIIIKEGKIIPKPGK